MLFVVAVALALGAITMAFKQGQANPDVRNFFESKSNILAE